MCGICGVVAYDQRDAINERILKRMCRSMAYRGPDDEGYYLDNHAMLGMRRLSIIDLDTGQQPITNEDSTLWLVFNGEIYNFHEIRSRLEKLGHCFRTQSDSEVIIHAFEEFGEHCLDHFNGMFAFAIWDATKQELFLARDRLGIKPLYFWVERNNLVFGSELKSIIKHPIVPRIIDPIALDRFLTLEYIPGPRTIFQNIHKLLPGHWIRFQENHLQNQMYWDITCQPNSKDQVACREELIDLIQDAVRLRLVSDVPLGAFLSGGIDSSSIVAFMNQTSSNEYIQTFSIGFEDETYNELPYSRAVASLFGTNHHEEILSPEIGILVEKLVRHLDEPLGDFSIFPTYLVSQVASKKVKVALSGDGGDEIFCGYDTYVAQRMDRYYRMLPAYLRQKTLPAIFERLPPQPAKKGLVNMIKRFVEGGGMPAYWRHMRWMVFLKEIEKLHLYQTDLYSSLDNETMNDFIENKFRQAAVWNPLAQQQYVDIKTYLVDNILTKVDRMSMAVSLEARVPLLDHRIVEFALNLPPALKLQGRETKIILRQAMQDYLPEAVLKKPKQGFSIPLKHWLRGPLKPLLTDLLSESAVQNRGYFNSVTINQWVVDHLNGRANYSHRLWALMVFELWQREYMDKNE